MNYLEVCKMMKEAAEAKTTYTPPAGGYPQRDAALDIIHAKETNYGLGAIKCKNPKSTAFGPFQINKPTYNYLTKKFPWLLSSWGPDPKNNNAPLQVNYTFDSLKDLDYSKLVGGAYVDDLANRFYVVNGRWPTMQELLSSYNGGLAGRNNAESIQYGNDATSYQWYLNQGYKKIPQWVLDNDPAAKQPAK